MKERTPMFRRMREAWRQATEGKWNDAVQSDSLVAASADNDSAVAAFREEVLTRFPYTDEAKRWLSTAVGFEVRDLGSTRGGGFWIPDQNKVFLYTAQYEAAIHELAHAWWHYRRVGHEEDMIEATIALSEERDPRYGRMARLAYGYIHGIPEQNWAGMLVERNDWEMYAGLASGMMADVRLLPPHVRPLYAGMYLLLPDDAPSPAETAPHR
jgi:hypothetical protein